ncbi:uncharacterized protein LOC126906380 [Daktulosphaira vitifoliae]|uniref:uncharacterized protein LOC126906380 n=1 Tax=Daktulosphaira vitifoliae TaxID=58002 RepID=UPI0021A9C63A|nr:uncharacterized protein LOC126906380 [Daktulosphaira vitifoliae]
MSKLTTKNKKTDQELCQIIASSITEMVRSSLNPMFRRQYFIALQVTNSTDAQKLIENYLFDILKIENCKISTNYQPLQNDGSTGANKKRKIEKLEDEISDGEYSD